MKQSININKWFYGFLTLHLFIWTLLPSFLRYTLPLDAMEGTTWGRQLAFGYDKNPFLNAWLTELAIYLGGKGGWVVYFFGQLCVVICFWAVWKLGKKILSPLYAFIAVLLLEFISNYNIDAIDFDDNVLLLAFWALIVFFFYTALQKQKIKDWILVGLFSGLAMLAKYYVVMLFTPMLIFLLCSANGRSNFFKPGIYVAVLVCLITVLPHLVWLFHHDFLTVRYAFFRTNSAAHWMDHLKFPWHFAVSNIGACLLPLLLFFLLLIGKKDGLVLSEKHPLTHLQWQFLWIIGLGPFILTLLLSVLTGMALHLGWGQPLLSFWGLILLAAIQPRITQKCFYRFLEASIIVFIFVILLYSVSILRAGNTSSANYPGKVMGSQLTQEWHDRYHQKLFYIIGPRWEAGVVSLYSADRPAVYMDFDAQASFWIDAQDVKQKGALVVWTDEDDTGILAQLKQACYHWEDAHTDMFYWMRSKHVNPIKIYVAFIPPRSS